MLAFTPDLQLQTLFVLNEKGRIVSTREPNPSPGPKFALIRGRTQCVWAVHADVPEALAGQVDALARTEHPTRHFRDEPQHATRYLALLGGRVDFGPAFIFPDAIAAPVDIVTITELSQLAHFRGWVPNELPERSPILAIAEEGHAASICFCARRSDVAAEAGVETADRFRGRGLGPRVTAAWALAIRASGRLSIY